MVLVLGGIPKDAHTLEAAMQIEGVIWEVLATRATAGLLLAAHPK